MRSATSILLAAGIVLAASACGGGGSSASRGDCNALVLNGARAHVVIKAYEAGELGTQMQVERSLGNGDVAAGKRYFTSSGHMRPYSSLKAGDEQGQFNLWMHTNPRVLAATLKQQNAAVFKASSQLKRTCG